MEEEDQVLNGDSEDNTLTGGSGDDVISGGDGDDVLNGAAGNDTLAGGGGGDSLSGGKDSDDDVLAGGPGVDTADFSTTAGPINADLSSGIATGSGNDVLSGIENLIGSDADDTLAGDGNDNTLDGGDGTDTADFSNAEAAITADLSAGTATGAGNDTLTNIENLTGSNQDDTLTGDSGSNTLIGGAGSDTINARSGDTVIGGTGGDIINVTGLDGAMTWVDPTAADTLRLDDVALTAEQVEVTQFQAEGSGEATARLRLDLDQDGQFDGDPSIVLSRLAEANIEVTQTGGGGTAITFDQSDLGLENLSITDAITAFYVAFLDRAPDPDGLDFWVTEYNDALDAGQDSRDTLNSIARMFRISAEAGTAGTAIPGEGADVDAAAREAFVTGIYDRLLNRTPEDGGLTFWSEALAGRLDTSGAPVGKTVVDMIDGAQDGANVDINGDGSVETVFDATTLRNKIEFAQQFTATLEANSLTDVGADFTLDQLADELDDIDESYASFQTAIDSMEIDSMESAVASLAANQSGDDGLTG